MMPSTSNKAKACGVIIREGNNLIGFDRCDDKTRDAGIKVVQYTTWKFRPGIEILTDEAQSIFAVSFFITTGVIT